jgi:2-haloacid dehalogenase
LKNYKALMFDADDTLFDFKTSQTMVFFETLKEFGISENQQAIYTHYQKVSGELWSRHETGEITKDFLCLERFRRISEEFSLNVDAKGSWHRFPP